MIISEQTLRDTLFIDEENRDSYLLYGSYARGDYESSSDIDILRITTSRMRTQRIDGSASLHIYDIKDLLEMARRGSLFILHLVREAKPIVDPCGYLGDLSAAFQKPDSYASDARRTVGPASALLDISESLFETAPPRFMDATLFLCRTLLYAEHADRGPFSFSLRTLAATDEIASMISNIKDHQSVSYSDFRRIRQVVRSKVEWSACPEALSIDELAQRSQGDPLFDSLMRRIVDGLHGDGYLMPPNVAPNNSLREMNLHGGDTA
jgi:hypothetical protein